MSARDTQFACFAQLLVDDLRSKAHITVHPNSAYPAVEPLIEKIIAQRAYDLVKHAVEECELQEGMLAARMTSEALLHNIPDMTNWPEN